MAGKPKKRQRNVSGVDAPVKGKSRRSKEGLQSKRESDRRRGQTRITIGVAFPRWRALKKEMGLRADTDVALLLLNSYEEYRRGPFASTPMRVGGDLKPPHPPSLSSNGTEFQSMDYTQDVDEDETNDLIIEWDDTLPSSCGYEGATADEDLSNSEEDTDCSDADYVPSLCVRTGGTLSRPFPVETLPTAGMEEIVHNLGGNEESSMPDITPAPDYQQLYEEDIVELPQQHVCKEEEEVPTDQQLYKERNSSLDQEGPEPPQIKEEQDELCISLDQDDPEPPQIKEEQEELCTSLDPDDPEPPQIKEEQEEVSTGMEGEQLALKQETETFILTPTCEDSDNSEDQTLDLSPDETQSAAEKLHVVIVSVKGSVEPEPNSDDRLLSHNSPAAESQDHKDKHEGSESTRNAEPKPKKRHQKSHSDNICNPTMSKIQHKGKRVLKCDTCEKAFKSIYILNRHQIVHTGEKPYPCNTCEKRFSQSGSLKEHMKVHTGEKPYPCNTCEKRFSKLGHLKEHMKVHTGEKPYPCNTCEKRFSKLEQLHFHMTVHTGEKLYPCNTCEKRFSRPINLKCHMRVHTGEKPYPCNICEKRFSYQGALTNHMRVHTGEKPYPCNTCEKRFSRQCTLKKHMRVHTGEKPYTCKTCDKRFSHRDTLKVHMRVHTGEKPYNCKT